MLSTPRQIAALLEVALRSLKVRRWRALSTVLGTVGVVAVFVSVLSISEGYGAIMRTTSGKPTVRILMQGAPAEIASSISGDEVALLRSNSAIARFDTGDPIVSAELVTSAKLPTRGATPEMSFTLRGVEPAAYALSEVRIASGRKPLSGRREMIVGKLAADRLRDAAIGTKISSAGSDWTIVGTFTSASGLAESELWVDAGALATSLNRNASVQSLHLVLKAGTTVAQLQEAIDGDPRLTVRAMDQAAYLAEQSSAFSHFVNVIAYGISILMAMGAAFAALGMSYASTTARIREIGTVQAIGYRRSAVFGSILLETIVLTVLGGVIGALGAYLVFDGVETSTMLLSSNYTQVGFAFHVSPAVLLQAAVLAVAIGFLGSLYPAIHVLRIPISTACGERR